MKERTSQSMIRGGHRYELRTSYEQSGDQYYGALYRDGKAVSSIGWWPARSSLKAVITLAIDHYEAGRLQAPRTEQLG
jgi:hypothetical protein